MAWNEPGGDKKDPWTGGNNDGGPPDIDEVVRKLQQRINGFFGGKKNSGDSSGSSSGGGGLGLGVLAVILLIVWGLTGFYIVEAPERGVVFRFGKYVEITQPGLNWRMPFPIGTVETVNVDQIDSLSHRASMLTQDENIVDIAFRVQYKIQDPADFLFQDSTPIVTLGDVTETSVRETIGRSDLDFILTEGRSQISASIRESIQSALNQYRTGLKVVGVEMQSAKPPEQVKSSFDDAIKAREDKERLENKAQAYANEIIPKARGAAARRVADAEAYRAQTISEAEGETSRFLAVLKVYQMAPEVTRKRLYLETMQNVLGETGKILVDSNNSNNLMYLPIEKLMQSARQPKPEFTVDENINFGSSSSSDSREPVRPAADRTRRPR